MSKMDVDGSFAVGCDTNPRPCHRIPLGDVDNSVLLNAHRIWEGLRDGRRFPPRQAITPRVLKPILRNTTLIKVIEGGSDYEYRIVGDASVMAHGQSFQGLRWSQTEILTPRFPKFIKPYYDSIVREGEPLAMRGWVARSGQAHGYIYCEYLYLPLGEAEVDHILVVAVYHRRDGHAHTTEMSRSAAL
jgi:hypothetical protein